MSKKYILIISIFVLALIAFNIGLGDKNIFSNKPVESKKNTEEVVATSTPTKTIDEDSLEEDKSDNESAAQNESAPLIGGDYELIDKNGKPVKSDQFLGKKQIVYFGFTNCPMVCPTAVNNISVLMNELGDAANNYTPIFISTDPERDTPARLTDYFANMHQSFIPLTGTIAQVEQTKKAFKVYAAKIENPENPANYDMNHSSIIYILDEQGKYLTHFSSDTKIETMVEKLKEYEK